jgi:hypothetical protein
MSVSFTNQFKSINRSSTKETLMKADFKKCSLTALALAALLGWTSCSTTPKQPAASGENPATDADSMRGAIVLDAVTATVTVKSVNRDIRTVVLQRADGSLVTYKCGPEVRNFDQIKPGDLVTVTAAEEVAVSVTPGMLAPTAGQATVVVRSPLGDKPGGRIINTVGFIARVVALDPASHHVTLLLATGERRTIKLGPNVSLANVKLGDDVGVQLTEAVAIYVTAPGAAGALTPDEARAIGLDAYIYGYPLVTMEYTRRIMTNVKEPEGTHAPMGQFVRAREYPNASFHDVTAPNADTLYTTTWLDVSKEPWVLSLPDAHDRYYLFPMLDAWTDVFQVPGKRTTGTGPQKYAITGPGWSGTLPEGVVEYKSPTSLVWILGRIYCTGTPEDYEVVHKLQDEISVVPLSAYGQSYTPPPGEVDTNIDTKIPTRDQVDALDTSAYFNLLASLMKNNPPADADAPILARMARIGLVPGQPFDPTKLDPAVQQALQSIPKAGVEKIMAWSKGSIAAGESQLVNGWLFTTNTGIYGTDYLQRALITAIGLGANRPQDAIYPTTETDTNGAAYRGQNHYEIHFDKDQLPPAKAFWSLTLYDDQYFFFDNPLNRYTLSSRNEFKTNPDGSVDLYIQNEDPGPDKQANWLPAPHGKFVLMLRLYWPSETPPSILDGTWTIPLVKMTYMQL